MSGIDLYLDFNGERVRISGARLRTQADADELIDAINIVRRLLPGATEKAPATAPEGEHRPVSPSPNSPQTATEPGDGSQPSPSAGSSRRANVSIGVTGGERAAHILELGPEAGDATPEAPEANEQGGNPVGANDGLTVETFDGIERETVPGKSAGSQGSAAPTLKDRILALHAEHPGLTAIEAADTLGVKRTSVSAYSSSLGIRWATAVQRRDGMGERVAEMHAAHRDWPASRIAEELGVVAPYVRATAKRKGFILPPESARSGSGRREAPTPAPEPESPPAAVRQPIAAIPSGSGSAIITKPIAKPKGTQFYLRNDVGEYLHCSCESMTGDRNYAWRGNEQHLVAVRRRFPLAQDLREQVIEKEQARVAA